MRMPILTFFTLFVIILTLILKKNESQTNRKNDDFWERERKANFTRKKDIENLAYISFDPDSLPLFAAANDVRAAEYAESLLSLKDKRILNCTGMTNTDLKLKYGAPNLTRLTEYDQNFTVLVRDLSRLAERYIELSLESEAVTILEYSIDIGSDVRLSYEMLGNIYAKENDFAKINNLIEKAEKLNSLSKNSILRYLNDIIPF